MSAAARRATLLAVAALLCAVTLLSYAYEARNHKPSVPTHFAHWRRSDQALKTHHAALRAPKLTKQLVHKHAINGTIVIAFANAHHLDYTFNWLTYIAANNITNYLVGAIDRTTATALADAAINHFSMYGDMSQGISEMPEGDLPFLSPGFLTIGLHKLGLIKTILSYDVDMVVSDVDTVWLQNPLPYFAQFPEADILSSSDAEAPSYPDGGLENPQVMGRQDLNIGIMVLRSSERMIQFVEAWEAQLRQKGAQQLWDQVEFNNLLRINMFKNHYSWWDHTDKWDRVFKPQAAVASNRRIVWGFDHTVTVAALPVASFANGHVFFTQKLYQRLQLPLYVVHANYAAGGIKRHRLREAQLWQYDKPEYYDVPQLLSFDMHTLQPPSNWNKLLTKQRIQFHIKNVGVQLQQFWDAAGAAVALNRTLIFPTFTCYCDEVWYWSLEVNPGYRCRWPGARNQTLPFACPPDHIVNYQFLDDDPGRWGAVVRYRESTFLDSPKTPNAIKNDVVRIRMQLPDEEEVTLQPAHIYRSNLRQQRQLLQSSEPIITEVPVAWTATENELRDSLSQYKSHRVLHFTEVGHVVLNTYRAWDRRRSHASLDKWRFMLYTSVN